MKGDEAMETQKTVLTQEKVAALEKEHDEFVKRNRQYEKENTEIYKPDDFTSPEVLYEVLKKTILNYHPSADLSLIEKAYVLAKKAHENQKRKNGEPYIIHPLCVGIILAELELDKETIAAGILHDVVEDTPVTIEDIAAQFGDEIALLVDGVTKLTQLTYAKDKVEVQAENLRKMFLAMAKDIRVILIKLADRLHNQRTMQYQKPEKAIEKSKETLEIYSPIAQRLGISKVKIELDDLALKFIHPDIYEELNQELTEKLNEQVGFIGQIKSEITDGIKNAGIEAKIEGRVKHLFSIYKKMVNKNKTLDQIYDLYAFRILVDSVKDCYAALGVVHEMYKPIPGRFKDYIAMPKPNMYQSLHTTLMGPNGQPFEVQIRTFEMHRIAEYGIAAHWKYKEAQDGKSPSASEEEKLTWLRQILEWQNDMSSNKEFMEVLKNDLDLFSDSVYCFTPSGDVKNLPVGSTPIDFAYSIHSAVGNKMTGARVNGRLVTIDYKIQNGDRVEIITSQNSKGPSRDWLNIVKSAQAKSKINQWFRTELKEDNVVKGKQLLIDYCKSKGISAADIFKPEFEEACRRKYGFDDWKSIVSAVGHGGMKEGQIVNKLVEEYDKKHRKELTDKEVLGEYSEGHGGDRPVIVKAKGSIVVQGMDDVSVHFSKCCSPVPGDEIVGFVTRGRGVSIHRTDCVNIMSLSEFDRERLIEAEWAPESGTESDGEHYVTEIKVYANNRSGELLDISKIFTENKIDIKSMNVATNKAGKATITIGFEVNDKSMLKTIADKVRAVPGIIDVTRS